MVCKGCGTKVGEGDVYCVKCGSKLRPVAGSRQGWLLAIVAILVAFALAAVWIVGAEQQAVEYHPSGVAAEDKQPIAQPAGDVVYVTASGSKYHQPHCRYAADAMEIPKQEALLEGYEPCKSCHTE